MDADGFASRQEVFGALRDRFRLDDPIESLIDHYRSTYPHCFAPDPGVNNALIRLRNQGWKIGIVTNGPSTQAEKIERAGLSALVDAVCISDLVGVAKPDRRIFDEAVLRCLGSPAPTGPAWMVGDTATPDIAGGAGAGLRTLWMHRGRQWEANGFKPDATAATIAHAVSILLEAQKQPSPS